MKVNALTKYHLALLYFSFVFYIRSGLCLECFVCHSKDDKDCSDPFEMNRNTSVDCQRVRDVGLGLMAAANALGGGPSASFTPLSQPPHVCFKLIMGNYLVRGCGKPDTCQNHTEIDCLTCDEDSCNGSQMPTSYSVLLVAPLIFVYGYLF